MVDWAHRMSFLKGIRSDRIGSSSYMGEVNLSRDRRSSEGVDFLELITASDFIMTIGFYICDSKFAAASASKEVAACFE